MDEKYYITIDTDGNVNVREVSADMVNKEVPYQFINDAVGGWIEHINTPAYGNIMLWGNEEAFLYPTWHRNIVGEKFANYSIQLAGYEPRTSFHQFIGGYVTGYALAGNLLIIADNGGGESRWLNWEQANDCIEHYGLRNNAITLDICKGFDK